MVEIYKKIDIYLEQGMRLFQNESFVKVDSWSASIIRFEHEKINTRITRNGSYYEQSGLSFAGRICSLVEFLSLCSLL